MKKLIVVLFVLLLIEPLHSEWKRVFIINEERDGVWSIDSSDSLHCMVLYKDEGLTRILYSSDQGRTWEFIHDESFEWGDPDAKFPDPHISWEVQTPAKNWYYISFEKGVVKRSNNLGKTIDTLHIAVDSLDDWLRYLAMYDSTTGICANNHYFYFTEDGFDSYIKIKPYDTNYIPKIEHVPSITSVCVKSKKEYGCGLIAYPGRSFYSYTQDNGKTWKVVEFPVYHPLEKIFFLNDTLGWSVAYHRRNLEDDTMYDVIYKTTDGGNNWELKYFDSLAPMFGLMDIAFRDSQYGIATGYWGKILITTDGGESWQRDLSTDYIVNYCVLSYIHFLGTKPILATAHLGLWTLDEYVGVNDYVIDRSRLIPYPNPVSQGHTLNIEVEMESNANITIDLINILGVKVAEVYNGYLSAGKRTIFKTFKEDLPLGTYYLRMTVNGREQIVKTVVLE